MAVCLETRIRAARSAASKTLNDAKKTAAKVFVNLILWNISGEKRAAEPSERQASYGMAAIPSKNRNRLTGQAAI